MNVSTNITESSTKGLIALQGKIAKTSVFPAGFSQNQCLKTRKITGRLQIIPNITQNSQELSRPAFSAQLSSGKTKKQTKLSLPHTAPARVGKTKKCHKQSKPPTRSISTIHLHSPSNRLGSHRLPKSSSEPQLPRSKKYIGNDSHQELNTSLGPSSPNTLSFFKNMKMLQERRGYLAEEELHRQDLERRGFARVRNSFVPLHKALHQASEIQFNSQNFESSDQHQGLKSPDKYASIPLLHNIKSLGPKVIHYYTPTVDGTPEWFPKANYQASSNESDDEMQDSKELKVTTPTTVDPNELSEKITVENESKVNEKTRIDLVEVNTLTTKNSQASLRDSSFSLAIRKKSLQLCGKGQALPNSAKKAALTQKQYRKHIPLNQNDETTLNQTDGHSNDTFNNPILDTSLNSSPNMEETLGMDQTPSTGDDPRSLIASSVSTTSQFMKSQPIVFKLETFSVPPQAVVGPHQLIDDDFEQKVIRRSLACGRLRAMSSSSVDVGSSGIQSFTSPSSRLNSSETSEIKHTHVGMHITSIIPEVANPASRPTRIRTAPQKKHNYLAKSIVSKGRATTARLKARKLMDLDAQCGWQDGTTAIDTMTKLRTHSIHSTKSNREVDSSHPLYASSKRVQDSDPYAEIDLIFSNDDLQDKTKREASLSIGADESKAKLSEVYMHSRSTRNKKSTPKKTSKRKKKHSLQFKSEIHDLFQPNEGTEDDASQRLLSESEIVNSNEVLIGPSDMTRALALMGSNKAYKYRSSMKTKDTDAE